MSQVIESPNIDTPPPPSGAYDVSLVMPCYNEADVVERTATELIEAFERSPHRLQLVTLDNGSTDGTGEILYRLAGRHNNVVVGHVEQNQGYGYGVLCGFPLCEASWVGIVPADGMVDADEILKLFTHAARLTVRKLVKARRRFRMDGLKRKVVSLIYNMSTNVLFGGLGSIDINGSPKLIPREYIERMNLQSKDWFLDAEMLIKAKRLGLGVYEKNVFAQLRPGGESNVNSLTCLEFVKNLLRYRFMSAKRMGLTPPQPQPLPAAGVEASVVQGDQV